MSHITTCHTYPQLHVDRPGYPNHCLCQHCQTLGRDNLTVAIEDPTKKYFTLREMKKNIHWQTTASGNQIIIWMGE